MSANNVEPISEKNLNNLMKKLKVMQSSLAPVVVEENPTGLKGVLMEAFRLCCSFSSITDKDELMQSHLKIREVLKTIETQTSKPIITPFLKGIDRKQRIKQLIEWVENLNVNLGHVDILEHTDSETNNMGFGLKLTCDLKRGDEVFKIPKNLILTAEQFMNDEFLGNVVEHDPLLSSMPNILLAFGLVIEFYKKNDSPWRFYLESLPHTYNNVCQFTPEDFAIFKGSPLYFDALNLWTSCLRQYIYLHLKFIECNNSTKPLGILIDKYDLKEKFNIHDYMWAASTVMSRMNPIPLPSKNNQHTLGLIPIMDLCNHTDTIFSVDFDVEKNICTVLCPMDLKKDDELLIFYGARPTSLLFIYNGFYIDNNPNDFYIFKVNQFVDNSLFELCMELLTRLNLDECYSHPLSMYTSVWCGDLRTIYRVLYCSGNELKQLLELTTEDLKTKLNSNLGISLDSELGAINKLKSHVLSIIDSYPPLTPISQTTKRYITISCHRYMENERLILDNAIKNLDISLKNVPSLYLSQ